MVSAIILAAGKSERFGDANKLIQNWHGKPLVRHVVDAAAESRLDDFVLITGHEADLVAAAAGPINIIHNADFRSGMASSISAGVNAMLEAEAVMILLGDMPLINATHINQMIGLYEAGKNSIVVATCDGNFGNPVLFDQQHFADLFALKGDSGARAIMETCADIACLELGAAARRDFDTRQAFHTEE